MKPSAPISIQLETQVSKVSSGCWEWTGRIQANGYGVLYSMNKMFYAHRKSYESFVGKIPSGMEIDHLCRNRKCVNPEHLEAVTHYENMMRGKTLVSANVSKLFCPKSHPYFGDNLYVDRVGYRHCKTCRKETNSRRHQ